MNLELLRISLLAFAILSIISQIPCTYYVVKLGSNLSAKEWKLWGTKMPSPQVIQAAVFSIIVATAIMFCALLKLHYIAGGWTVVEIFVAAIYAFHGFEYRQSNGNFKNPTRVEQFAGYTMVVLIPVCIFSFTFMYAEYDWLIQQFNK